LFSVSKNISDIVNLSFINRNPQASVYYHPAWLRALERTFGYNVHYLVIKDELAIKNISNASVFSVLFKVERI
jgi:hypothetical protein